MHKGKPPLVLPHNDEGRGGDAQRRTIAFSGSADRWGGRLAAAGLSEVARGAGA
ncbi:MAG: hypothetical protein M1582_03885 [Actinobacteria bacterium]|nr:hypothetical protein [Actinomycetota bacterium]